eukprot:4722782-Pyramimonas_sp.AAC.1
MATPAILEGKASSGTPHLVDAGRLAMCAVVVLCGSVLEMRYLVSASAASVPRRSRANWFVSCVSGLTMMPSFVRSDSTVPFLVR